MSGQVDELKTALKNIKITLDRAVQRGVFQNIEESHQICQDFSVIAKFIESHSETVIVARQDQ